TGGMCLSRSIGDLFLPLPSSLVARPTSHHRRRRGFWWSRRSG
ncbi:Os02g0151800, partial [Oryza sativa Japonica Group]